MRLLERAFGERSSFNLVTANLQPLEKYFLFQKKEGGTDYSKEFNKEISTFYEKDFRAL